MTHSMKNLRLAMLFSLAYVCVDWLSFIHPMGQLNITPWNPPAAVQVLFLTWAGLLWAPWVFITIGFADWLIREMVYRHPFPGPGLGVRILGEVKKEYADLLRRADAIFIEELRNFTDDQGKSWYDLTSQAFTVFLPVKSVGVMGDGRTYDYVVALRAVQTSDFMTADWAELPYALLKKVSSRIINEVRGINRVTYDVSSKPPATIEWE